MPPRRRLAALARAATGGAVAALTSAAERKAQELWLASAEYVGAADLSFEGRSYDAVRAMVLRHFCEGYGVAGVSRERGACGVHMPQATGSGDAM